MGSGYSFPSRETLSAESIKTSNVLDKIMRFMLANTNILDMYSLASPTECRKYALFTAKTMENFFKEINLHPLKGEDGKFYFQRLDTIQKLPDEFYKEQKGNCLEIAYFFIRILQIFAALSLSVMDMEIPRYNSDLDKREIGIGQKVNPTDVLAVPFFKPKQPLTRGLFTGGGRAGFDFRGYEESRRYQEPVYPRYQQPSARMYIRDPNYEILNRYLIKTDSTYFQFYDGRDATGIYLNLDGSNLYISFKGKKDDGKSVEVRARLNMRLDKRPEESKYDISLSPIKITGIELNIREIPAVTFTSSVGADPKYMNQTIPQYLRNIMRKILGKESDVEKRKGIPTDVLPDFKLPDILSSLSSKPPIKAYCVARAMQLLSPESLYGDNRKAKTQICNSGFKLLGRNLPGADKPITSSKGILTLNLLFYSMLRNNVPSVSEEVEPKYRAFLQEIRSVFSEDAEIKPIESAQDIKKVIEGIVDKIPTTLCAKTRGVMYTTDLQVIRQLRSYAGRLLSRQLQHTYNVMNILKRLFVLSSNDPILIQPSVQAGGMDAVEKIATLTRDLLTAYYTDCEVIYREGVEYATGKKEAFA